MPLSFDELDTFCLALAGATREHPFGPEVAVWKVGGRMFALAPIGANPVRVNLKCEPPLAEALREAWPQITPGWHMNKRHWNTVVLDAALPRELAHEMIEDSYDLVVEASRGRRR